jgi:hypothetical protein
MFGDEDEDDGCWAAPAPIAPHPSPNDDDAERATPCSRTAPLVALGCARTAEMRHACESRWMGRRNEQEHFLIE